MPDATSGMRQVVAEKYPHPRINSLEKQYSSSTNEGDLRTYLGMFAPLPGKATGSSMQTHLRQVAIDVCHVCHKLPDVFHNSEAEKRHGSKHVIEGDTKWNVCASTRFFWIR